MGEGIHIIACVVSLNGYPDKLISIPVNERHFNTILVIETLLELVDVSIGWEGQRDHLAEPEIRVGVKLWKSCQRTNPLLCVTRQFMALHTDFIPTMFLLKFYCRRD